MRKILGKYTVTQTISYLSHTGESLDRIASAIKALGASAQDTTLRSYYSSGKRGINIPKVSPEDAKVLLEAIGAPPAAPAIKKTHHMAFKTLLKFAKAGVNTWLVGPAGSGKTTAAQQVATELKLKFHFNGAIDSEYKLLGFIDANGRVVSRPFRDAWSNGGVYLFDEVDASLPGAVLAFNAALSNGICDFPDGEVNKHEDFICIAAGNTFDGTGEYVGRLKQDAAFLDRFAHLQWNYDEELERSICPNPDWCAFVQKCRANAKQHGLRVVISPRASLFGAKLLAAGIPQSTVIDATIRKGMTEDNFKKVVA